MGRAGQYVQQLTGYKAFMPTPLPPVPPLKQDDEYNFLLSMASLALGKLSGLASVISDPDLFVYLYIRKEALLSSQIEGTQCSLEDILSPDINNETYRQDDIEEVSNYVKAMNEGLKRLNDLPVCTRLIKEIHTTLMSGVRGANKTPGEFRQSQNWIGRPDANLMTAAYVPPPHAEVDRLMSELEKFVHGEDQIPHLVKAALVHAQFETIHPFLDGNGRLGRLLITYLLCFWKVLDRPLLYLSYYFKAHRSEYYAKLMDIRSNGAWENWIKFFLKAVSESADMANIAALEIHRLHQLDKDRIAQSQPTAYAIQVFNEFCRNPILNAAVLMERHSSTKPKISRALQHLSKLGIITEISGKQRNRQYAYSSYLQILVRDTTTQIG
jgi:Fic family protein